MVSAARARGRSGRSAILAGRRRWPRRPADGVKDTLTLAVPPVWLKTPSPYCAKLTPPVSVPPDSSYRPSDPALPAIWTLAWWVPPLW